MIEDNKRFRFKNRIFRWNSDAASWYFVHLEDKNIFQIEKLKKEKKIIKSRNGLIKIFVEAKFQGRSQKFFTSLLPNKMPNGSRGYMIAVNKKARAFLNIDEGDTVNITFSFVL